MTVDELKKNLGSFFTKDLSRIEPGQKGFIIGENIRVYERGEDGYQVRFLYGIPPHMRRPITDRMTALGAKFTVGPDFKL